ncbi:hypothetical protein V1514DRAFT_333703 [Lipomyces japonicus]|uniref:uncharacterized protein n=1 Tax=Lipomyces japonicus TaxID=56871 RepID=UPI0034CF2C5D
MDRRREHVHFGVGGGRGGRIGHVQHVYVPVPLYLHLFCGGISLLIVFIFARVLGVTMHYILDDDISIANSMTTTATTVTNMPSLSSANHHTLIDKFVAVLQEEFGAGRKLPAGASGASHDQHAVVIDQYLLRVCGVLLYTVYALVVAFALSLSALFHSLSFVSFIWRRWKGVGQVLFEVFNNS